MTEKRILIWYRRDLRLHDHDAIAQALREKACPFNFFYWDFLYRHQEKLRSQGRMSLILGNLKRMEAGELDKIHALAQDWKQNRNHPKSDERI